MYNIFFVIENITDQEKDVVQKCAVFLQEDINLFSFKIVNIREHKIDSFLKDNSIIISFGKIPTSLIKNIIEELNKKVLKHISLSHPKYLLKISQNKKTRDETFKILKDLKEFLKVNLLESNKTRILPEDITPVDKTIEEILLNIKTEKNFYFTSLNGKTIEVGLDKKIDSKADIYVTISELCLLKTIIQIFKPQEVIIEENPTKNIGINH